MRARAAVKPITSTVSPETRCSDAPLFTAGVLPDERDEPRGVADAARGDADDRPVRRRGRQGQSPPENLAHGENTGSSYPRCWRVLALVS